MKHIRVRNEEREISISEKDIKRIANNCPVDTAIFLGKTENGFRNWQQSYDESNGELVVLIVRDRKPVTVMYRRIEQPFTSRALRVKCVKTIY